MSTAPALKILFREGHSRSGIINSTNWLEFVIGEESLSRMAVLDYKNRIAKRVDASSAYLVSRNTINVPYLVSATQRKSDKAWQFALDRQRGDISVITIIPHDAITQDIALKRLKQRLSGDISQFQSLIPLGEIKETRDLIRSTADATTGVLLSIADIKKRGSPKRILKAASKAWLQFSFAISPTIADTKALLKSITEYSLRRDFSATHYGAAEKTWLSQGTPNEIGGASPTTWRSHGMAMAHKLSYKITAGVFYDIKSSNNYSAADHLGFVPVAVIPALWELTAFSWVADYFGTVGEYLSDVFQANGGNTIFCTRAAKYTMKGQSSFRNEWTNPAVSASYYSDTVGDVALFEHEVSIFQRVVLGQIPHRSLRFKTIDEIGANSVKRVLNLASVILSK